MSQSYRVTILGAGSSTGTPGVGVGWGDCDPSEPLNRRTRPSILAEVGGRRLLVDTSPDLREQLTRHEIASLDAVLFTHAHADHLHGVDDLRGVNRVMNAPLDAWMSADTLSQINERFSYVLQPLGRGATYYYKPTLTAHTFLSHEPFQAAGVAVLPIEQDHGFSTTHGFRIGEFAYTTDLVMMPEKGFEALKGVKFWIIGAFGWKPGHPTHIHVDGALEWIERIKPERAVLTHLSTAIDYRALAEHLPNGVEAAYDGMTWEWVSGDMPDRTHQTQTP